MEAFCCTAGSGRITIVWCVQMQFSRRSVLQSRQQQPVLAVSTATNGVTATTQAAKPILDAPIWHDPTHQTSNINTNHQLMQHRAPRTLMQPTRMRLFAGTANPVCIPCMKFVLVWDQTALLRQWSANHVFTRGHVTAQSYGLHSMLRHVGACVPRVAVPVASFWHVALCWHVAGQQW